MTMVVAAGDQELTWSHLICLTTKTRLTGQWGTPDTLALLTLALHYWGLGTRDADNAGHWDLLTIGPRHCILCLNKALDTLSSSLNIKVSCLMFVWQSAGSSILEVKSWSCIWVPTLSGSGDVRSTNKLIDTCDLSYPLCSLSITFYQWRCRCLMRIVYLSRQTLANYSKTAFPRALDDEENPIDGLC